MVSLTVSDHANFANHGEDLVCAGVSSIMVGTLNAIDQLCKGMCKLQMQNAYIQIQVITDCDVVQTILDTTCIQLQTMCESYDTFIKINEQEVYL